MAMFLLGGLKGVIVVCQLDTGKRSILMHYYSLDEFNCEYLNLVVQGLDFYNGIYIWACIQLMDLDLGRDIRDHCGGTATSSWEI